MSAPNLSCLKERTSLRSKIQFFLLNFKPRPNRWLVFLDKLPPSVFVLAASKSP